MQKLYTGELSPRRAVTILEPPDYVAQQQGRRKWLPALVLKGVRLRQPWKCKQSCPQSLCNTNTNLPTWDFSPSKSLTLSISMPAFMASCSPTLNIMYIIAALHGVMVLRSWFNESDAGCRVPASPAQQSCHTCRLSMLGWKRGGGYFSGVWHSELTKA